jgi:hypothetical protein
MGEKSCLGRGTYERNIVNRFVRTRIWRRAAVCGATVAVAAGLATGPAWAATDVYPAGGNGFDTSTEGWSPGGVSCTPATAFCTPEAAYDSGVGNPPGSISARTTVTVNLLDLFSGTEIWDSPRFTVPVGAVTNATLRLDRAFEAGGLVNVEPKGTYTVTLRDLTAGTSSVPLSEGVGKADSTFATRGGSASVVGGHAYQLSIEATTAQSSAAVSLVSGTTNLRFDNIGLRVETAGGGSGGGGGNGGKGANGLSNGRLLSLLQSSSGGPAVLKGNRLLVKVPCPARVGSSCHLAVQGLLKKRKPATATRRAMARRGKTRKLVLRVKPKALKKISARRKLLFKETVKAGGAKATVYKRLKLIRR